MSKYAAIGFRNAFKETIKYLVPLTDAQIEREENRLKIKYDYKGRRKITLVRMRE